MNQPVLRDHIRTVTTTLEIDQPYWLAAPHDGLYHPLANGYAGIEPASSSSSRLGGFLELSDGLQINYVRSPMYKWVDRVAGERTRPVVITPIASLRVIDPVVIVRGERSTVSIEVESLCAVLSGTLQLTLPDGWSITDPPPAIAGLKRGERRTVDIGLQRTRTASGGKSAVSLTGPQGTADRTMHVIDYPHILPQTWYSPAEITLLPLDVEVNAKTVGYVEGAGDDVPRALERLGLTVTRVDPATAHASDLDKLDAIVTGIRAYNTVPALARFQPQLLAYVERGGTLLIQYNTNGNDLVMSAKDIGPFPFTLTRDRVTVEEAPPTFLAPDHPLMNEPNVIGLREFEGWVQERGLYFTGDIDSHYTPLIAWNDPGEHPLNGALVACDFGKGRFVYTGISLFRQLPAGVPGAYRLLANLVSRRTTRQSR